MKTIFCSLFLIFVLLISAANAADDWTQKFPNPKPSARFFHSLTYIGGENVLLFGGKDVNGNYLGDTWVYNLNANTWTNKNPQGNKPSARAYHGMAYIGDGKVLLFGGSNGSEVYLGDTWVYNLSTNT